MACVILQKLSQSLCEYFLGSMIVKRLRIKWFTQPNLHLKVICHHKPTLSLEEAHSDNDFWIKSKLPLVDHNSIF